MSDNLHPFAQHLMAWYHLNKRDLPWRNTKSAYEIWISEVILQQTRVNQGMPYYYAFLDAFPTVIALAESPVDAVLRVWQGLGYYSRARNLHSTAKEIVARFNGNFPTTYKDLISLKGIGPYTAAAVASFSSNETVAAIDGNVNRVVARYFGIETLIDSSTGKKDIAESLALVFPDGKASTFNQAIMEFGAMQCKPLSPDCLNCPLSLECVAKNKNLVSQLPNKQKKKAVSVEPMDFLLLETQDGILMRKRPEAGIWAGLFEPLLTNDIDSLSMKLRQNNIQLEEWGKLTHLLTHKKLLVSFYYCYLKDFIDIFDPKILEGYQPYTLEKLELLPKPVIISRLIQKKFQVRG